MRLIVVGLDSEGECCGASVAIEAGAGLDTVAVGSWSESGGYYGTKHKEP